MPFVEIPESPLAPGLAPVRLHYRESGRGVPLVFLHSGWGYELYPFDRVIAALGDRFRILIPDRSGYGSSPRIAALPADFHQHAATEALRFLDALRIEGAALWGHSDGAVIAALLGLAAPKRFSALILEAFHYRRTKRGSVDFFATAVADPEKLDLSDRTRQALARDHGAGHWKEVITLHARAWLEIVNASRSPQEDLYGGRLSGLVVPALFLQGARDPSAEPGDLNAVRAALPRASFRVLEGAGHSPHSEPASAAECIRAASEFLQATL